MTKRRIKLVLCIIGFALSAAHAFSQETRPGYAIVTTGIADISDNDIVSAQGRAIADAQRKALIQAVGTIMTFEQIDRQFASLKRVLFDKAVDYIDSYRILYDSTLGDRYHITLQSTIDLKKLEEYLVADQSLAPENKLPTILLMIAQQRPGQDFYTCWWSFIDPETALTALDQTVLEELQKQGFEVIDHTYMINQISSTNVYGCLDIKGEAVQAVGRQFQADVVIIGNAQVEPTDDKSQVTLAASVQASITARAVKTADGSTIAALETYMPSSGPNADAAHNGALKKTARMFAHQTGEQIALRWTKESKGILLTTLSVSGISSYIDFSSFKSALRKHIPAIRAIVQKSPAAKGTLLELESSADTLTLAQEISKKQFEGFTISLKRISPPLIEAEVRVNREEAEEQE